MPKHEPVTVFTVEYEPKPDYKGEWQMPITPGVQGKFRYLHEAVDAARECLSWFNNERYLVDEIDEDGEVQQVEQVDRHDNVIVHILKEVDGGQQEEVEWEKNAPPKRKVKRKVRRLARA